MRTLRVCLPVLAGLALAIVGALMVRPHGASTGGLPPSNVVRFLDISSDAGIAFTHCSGARGKKFMPETVGSGVAFLDYNNDGWPDIFFVNSTDWPGRPKTVHHYPALYRNNGDGTFTDVTMQTGLAIEVYGMGVAVGDYNNDGFADMFLTCIGPNHLFRNNGDGTFKDVTAKAGVAGVPVEPGGIRWKWSASAAWCDFDRDGVPDLFVCNYVHWTPETDVYCKNRAGQKAYCAPYNYEGVPCTLYRGRGDGTFEDVSDRTGISHYVGKSFGVIAADLNGDGWIDFAVTNDTSRNFFFVSERGSRFREVATESGFALSDTGQAKAGMGLDAADFENNGHVGLLAGNFSKECLSLYRNDGSGAFLDVAFPAGVAQPSLTFLTFGLFFFDFDLDGRQDIFTANGHISEFANESDSMITYRERPLLYHNLGAKFKEVGEVSGPALDTRLVGRGCAWGDFDLDGDPDIAIVWNNGNGMLWRNEGRPKNHWIGLKLKGTRSIRDAFGAVIHVESGDMTQTIPLCSGGSFLSSRQPWPLIGLGKVATAEKIDIAWPSGMRTEIKDLAANHYYEIVEGESIARLVSAKPPIRH
jgi:hypothetical protein